MKGLLKGAATDQRPISELPGGGMLYVTDRVPSEKGGGSFYESARGGTLRAGEAKVAVQDPDLTWDEMRRDGLLKKKGGAIDLRVTGVEEFGLLETPEGLRIYGAGIVSSRSESLFSLDDPSPNRIGFNLERLMRTPYRIDDFQQV